ncbi:MAG: phosphate uptake regulator PhoU [Candidatus Altiarchaeia archaeon]
MEYRKIQLTGESTYIVSLPKTWVTKNKIEKGDVVYVIEKGEEVILRLKEEKEREVEIKIKTNDLEFLGRLLITKYIQGYDTIVFSAKDHLDHRIRENLIQVSSFLIGLEPFGESKDSITFRMLMKGGKNAMESIERMHDLSILSLRELIDYIDSGMSNESMLNGIIQRDNEIDKFYFLILRQLSTTDGFESIIYGQVAKSLERISDHIETVASLLKEGKRMKPDDYKLFRQVADLYEDVMLTLKNRDLTSAEEILQKIQKFRVAEKKIMSNLDDTGAKNILVYASFRRIGEYISDIAESVINLS